MWIPSSPCKNRVSDRGRIDIFSRASISGWKASLLLLALASFSVVCAASGLPEGCVNLDTCFATDSDELKDGPLDYIRFEDGKITWDTKKSDATKIDLYTRIVQKCGKLSFSMSKPDNLGDDCNLLMHYGDGCEMDILWTKDDRLKKVDLKFYYEKYNGYAVVGDVSEANVDLDGAILTCKTKNNKDTVTKEGFCLFETSKDGDWCRFKFAFYKKTGSCDGKIQFDTDYKLLATPAPTTVAPKPTTTPDANYEKTTPGVDAAGLSPWIIAAIVVGVLFLLCCIVGIVACLWCRRCKRRRLTKKMAENGYGSDYECETVVSSHSSLQTAIRMNEERRSSTGNAEEPKSRKKRKTKGTRRLHFQKKEDLKAQPIPVPARRRKEDLYELLGEPIKPIQPAGEPEKPSAQPSTKTAKPMQHNSINKIPVNNPCNATIL